MAVRVSCFLLILVFIFPTAGCTYIENFAGQVFLMTPEQEAKLGVELAAQIEKEYPIYKKDPAATAYIEQLGQKLVAASPIPVEQEFHFQLVDSEEVNAFAIPGGWCYIQLGLIRQSASEAELASVIAHEIGHVTGRHGARSLSRSQFYGSLGSLLVSEDSGALADLAVQITQSGILLRHGRMDELESDDLAVRNLVRVGIDPNGLATFFQKLAALQRSEPSALASYFSTHPLTSERIGLARQRIDSLGVQGQTWQPDSSEFTKVKRRFPLKSN